MNPALAISINVIFILGLFGLLFGPHIVFRMDWQRISRIWRELRPEPTGLVFSASLLENLPEPVQRYFRHALAEGTVLMDGAVLRIDGQMRLSANGAWQQMSSRERIRAGHGLLWPAHVLMGPLWIIGRDCYYRGQGSMQWWMMGMLRVARAQGPVVDESAAGRMAAEMIWLPGMLLPQFGNEWTALSEDEILCRLQVDGFHFELHLMIGRDGALQALRMHRMRSLSGGISELQPFGMDSNGEISSEGCTVPAKCSVAWNPDNSARRFEFWRGDIAELSYSAELAPGSRLSPALIARLR